MSNTNKDKLRRKCQRAYKIQSQLWSDTVGKFKRSGYSTHEAMRLADIVQGKDVYSQLSAADYYKISNYSRNPAWWNKLTFHKPLRRRVRDKLQVQTIDSDEDLQLDFKNKPMDYFW